MEVKEYLDSKGLEAITQGDNWQMDCPFCDDGRKRLGIHKLTGKWNCFHCGLKGGTINSFQKRLEGSDYQKVDLDKTLSEKKPIEIPQNKAHKCHEKLTRKDRQALSFLRKERGFNLKAINHFILGSFKKKGYEYVSIPFFENNKLVNVKYRAIDFKDKRFKWRRIQGGKSSLFNDEVIDNLSYERIFICEAELDCISLWNAGIKNVISVTTGAKAFKAEWYDRLKRFKKIYLVFDNDEAGQDGANKMAKRLGLDRTFNVVLPKGIKDVNEYFWDKENKEKRNTKKDFIKLVKESKKISIPDVITLNEGYKELIKKKSILDEDEIYGLQTPWAKVNKILKGAKPGHLVVVTANPKVGKCLKHDNKIVNPNDGSLITIEQAVKNKLDVIHSYNEKNKKIEIKKISDWYDSGIQPLLRVTTQLGNYTEPTYEHPYLTFKGWKKANELREGEFIAIPNNLPVFGNVEWSLEKTFVIGSLIADGGLTTSTVNWTKKDEKLISIMIDSVKNVYGLGCNKRDINTYTFTNGRGHGVNPLMKECKNLGITCLSKNKKIPEIVFNFTRNSLINFLSALWSGDGTVSYIDKSDRILLEYSSASETLIDQLQHLFLRFGILLKKRHKIVNLNNKKFNAWILSTSQSNQVLKFKNIFKLFSDKKQNILEKFDSTSKRDYITSYPKEIWPVILKEIDKSDYSKRDILKKLNIQTFKINGNCSKFLIDKINKLINSKVLKSYLDSDVSFVKVKKIENIGNHQCYDLTVPDNHSFICNNTVVHNTTLVLNWMLSLAMTDVSSFMYCCEMRQLRLVEKTVAMYCKDFTTTEDMTIEQIVDTQIHTQGDKILLGYPQNEVLNLDNVCEKIKEVVKRYGCKFVCFDNLHFLIRGDNVKDKIGEITRRFKMLAEQLDIVIALISHPRKINSNKSPTADDLKDSSSIFQDLDSLLILHRRRLDTDERDTNVKAGQMENITEVSVISRWGEGGSCYLLYNGTRSMFVDHGDQYRLECAEYIQKYFKRKSRKR